MGLEKFLTGANPDSEIGAAQQEAMQDMIQEFMKSEKGQKLMATVMSMIAPAFDGLKKEMGNDEKFFMLRMNKKSGVPVFYSIDTKKIDLQLINGCTNFSEGMLTVKPISDPTQFFQDMITGELMGKKSDGAK